MAIVYLVYDVSDHGELVTDGTVCTSFEAAVDAVQKNIGKTCTIVHKDENVAFLYDENVTFLYVKCFLVAVVHRIELNSPMSQNKLHWYFDEEAMILQDAD